MFDTPPVWPGHVKTWFQLGTTMLDTYLGGLGTWKHVVPARTGCTSSTKMCPAPCDLSIGISKTSVSFETSSKFNSAGPRRPRYLSQNNSAGPTAIKTGGKFLKENPGLQPFPGKRPWDMFSGGAFRPPRHFLKIRRWTRSRESS